MTLIESLPVYRLLACGALASICVGIFMSSYIFFSVSVEAPTYLGLRGLKRRKIIVRHALFVHLDRLLRRIANVIGILFPRAAKGEAFNDRLRQAGFPLGIDAVEFFILRMFFCLLFGVMGYLTGSSIGSTWQIPIFFLLFGWFIPTLKVRQLIKERQKVISRLLPDAIDLAALCMSAGLDFVSSVRMISDDSDANNPLAEELQHLLRELDFGHTRRAALESFGKRVPTPIVRDFVNAVTQAEEKGNPLSSTLQIQAKVLRQKRSVLAEEQAARAAVLLFIPLTMTFAAVLILVIAPLILTNMEAGFR